MVTTPLGLLPSRTPEHPRRSALRTDPFLAWRGPAEGVWRSADDARRLGSRSVPAWMRMHEGDAWERILAPRNRERMLRTLAALDSWRTLTVEQLEAITDTAGLARGRTSLLTALWTVGLVEVGWHRTTTIPVGDGSRDEILLRLCTPKAAIRRLAGALTWGEWNAMHAGLGFDIARQFPRHNVLAAELGLRLAEFGHGVGMVLGEKLSAWELLTFRGAPGAHPLPKGTTNGGDLTVIRRDGLRILVEVTATANEHFAEKVGRLAQFLAYRGTPYTGMMALFVIAPRRDEGDSTKQLARKARDAVTDAVRRYPGPAHDPTAARIGVITWEALFPEGGARDDFGMLPAMLPTGPNGELVPSYMLRTPLAPADPAALSGVVKRAGRLRGVPHQLRSGEDLEGSGEAKVRARPDTSLARLILA